MPPTTLERTSPSAILPKQPLNKRRSIDHRTRVLTKAKKMERLIVCASHRTDFLLRGDKVTVEMMDEVVIDI